MSDDVKWCRICGAEFHRRPNINKTQWAKRRHCSKECHRKAQIAAKRHYVGPMSASLNKLEKET